MTKEQDAGKGYIKKETMLLVVLIALAAGFLGGVVFTVFKSAPGDGGDSHEGHEHVQSSAEILALERQVAADPDNMQAWIHLGHLNFEANRHENAIMAYNKALALNPNNPNVWTDLGVMYRRNGQPEKAVESFDRARLLDPRHEQSRLNKGIVLKFDLKDEQGALQAWEEALQLNPAAKMTDGTPLWKIVDDIKRNMAQQQK